MGRELTLGMYKIVSDVNEKGAYKAQVFSNTNGKLRLQAEFYGPEEYTAIIKAIGAMLGVFGEHKALLVALLHIGYGDGHDQGVYGLDLKDGLEEIEEIFDATL